MSIPVALVCLAVALVGAVVLVRNARRQRDKVFRAQDVNTEDVQRQDEMICAECTQSIDAAIDLYIGDTSRGTWWHRKCYKRATFRSRRP